MTRLSPDAADPLHFIDEQDRYPLSALQHATLLHSLITPEEGVYLQQKLLTLREDLNLPAFEAALRALVERHPVLRTSFHLDLPSQPLQVVHHRVQVSLEKHDWRGLSPIAQRARLREYLDADKRKPFDFAQGPPLRFALFRTGEAAYELVWSSHHALMDGRSYLISLTEMFALYEARLTNEEVELPRRRPFSDYIHWLAEQDAVAAKRFWRERLSGITAPTPLGADPDQRIGPGEGVFAEMSAELSEKVTAALVATAQSHRVTANNFIQGGWALLLSRISGREDVLFGTTRSCRGALEGGRDMIGLCVNTIPFRARVDPELGVIDFTTQLREQQLALRPFAHTPLPQIRECSDIPRPHPLFESVVVFEDYVINTRLRSQGGGWANRQFRLEERNHYPLTLSAYLDSRLMLKLGYDRRRFSETAAGRILFHLRALLEAMVGIPGSRLKEVLRLTEPGASLLAGQYVRPAYAPRELDAQQARRIEEVREAIRPHEVFWGDRLARLEALDPACFDRGRSALGQRADAAQYFEMQFDIPNKIRPSATNGEMATCRSEWLLTVFLAFLLRVSGEDGGDVDLRWRAQSDITHETDGLFAAYVPLRIPAPTEEASLSQFYEEVSRQHRALGERKTYLRDVWARHPQLRTRDFADGELPIAIELVEEPGSGCGPRGATALHFEIPERGDECRWLVAEDRCERRTAEALGARFAAFLQTAADLPDCDMGRLPLLTDEDRRRLAALNDTAMAYPRDRCAHQLFMEQASRRPGAPAVVFEGRTLTYGELNDRSSRLATFLKQQGIGPGCLVGLYLERSADLMVSLLGIMKAGAAYVPIDPAYPPDRVAYMLADADLPLLLTQSSLRKKVPDCRAAVVVLDESWAAIMAAHDGETVDRASPEGLAYVIYTSGSTGRPKGVEVCHRALTNLLCSMGREPGFSERDRLLAITTICFDIAALELYLPLIRGGVVEVAPTAILSDGFKLRERIEVSRPTVMQATPATWKMLRAAGWAGDPDMKILCGGEALPPALAAALATMAREVWNLYGPTETTIWSSACNVRAGRPVTIGRPIDNTQFYVLDKWLQPVAPGTPGELYIGGDGVAAGYLRQPELTAERFLPCPFAQAGAVMYRTGDLVRLRRDGNIEYLHRLDRQVKLHGHRIELGEVEHALLNHPAVREAVVVVREDAAGDRRLVAYLVPGHPEAGHSDAELRKHLKASLPDYMVPSTFVTIKRIPLTPNGKIDHKALPAPSEVIQPASDTAQLRPSNQVERRLAAIWCAVLGHERFGIDDSFFEVGGNSLLLMEVVLRLRAEWRDSLLTVDMFAHPTVRSMAQYLAQESDNGPRPDSLRLNTRLERRNQAFDELRRKRPRGK